MAHRQLDPLQASPFFLFHFYQSRNQRPHTPNLAQIGSAHSQCSGSLVPGSELWEFMNNADSWAHPELRSWSLTGWDGNPGGVVSSQGED